MWISAHICLAISSTRHVRGTTHIMGVLYSTQIDSWPTYTYMYMQGWLVLYGTNSHAECRVIKVCSGNDTLQDRSNWAKTWQWWVSLSERNLSSGSATPVLHTPTVSTKAWRTVAKMARRTTQGVTQNLIELVWSLDSPISGSSKMSCIATIERQRHNWQSNRKQRLSRDTAFYFTGDFSSWLSLLISVVTGSLSAWTDSI